MRTARLMPILCLLAGSVAAIAAEFQPVPTADCKSGFMGDSRAWQSNPCFIIGVEDWPHLGDAWPRQGGTRWPGWSYGQIIVPDVPANARTEPGPVSYITESFQRKLDGGRTFSFTVNRASPALRIDTDATQVEFFHGLKVQMQDAKGDKTFGPVAVAFATTAGPVVRKLDAPVDLSAMSEPWLLFWFGKDSGLRPNRNDWGWSEHWHVHDIYNVVPYNSDKPWLVILSSKARALEKKPEGGAVISFAEKAGTLLVAPFFGHRFSPVEETAPWLEGQLAEPARRASMLTPYLLAWPTSVEEQYSVDETADKVTLHTTFRSEPISTVWPVKPMPVALISPMLATAKAAGMKVSLQAGASEAELVDLQMPSVTGPLLGVKASASYDVVFTGLMKYIWQQPAAEGRGPIADFARGRLRGEIDKMLQAGILRPLRMVSGEMNPQYYWESPADTVWALAEAMPYLPDEQREQVKSYLKTYVEKFNPLKVGKVDGQEGTPREYFQWPKEDKWDKGSNTVPVGNLYAAWLYAVNAEDMDWARGNAAAAAMVFGTFERQSDWLQFGPIDRAYWQMHYPTDELNARLNGVIGYARLMRKLGNEAEVGKAEYLFARLAAQRIAGPSILPWMYQSRQVEWPYNGWNSSIEVAPQYAEDLRFRLLHTISRIDKFGPMLHTFSQQDDRGWIPSMVPFLNLSPEVARLLGEQCPDYCRAFLDSADYSWADWWVTAGAQQYGGENNYNPPLVAGPGFLAKAWIAKEAPEKLRMRLDVPICRVGDLEYLRKLSALIGRTGATQWNAVGGNQPK